MSDEYRIPPEDFLTVFKHEEDRSKTGQLKIFFGMSAGVGKTYAMLEAAQQKKFEVENLYIGIINTHGRQETAQLLEGLKVIPLKKIPYKSSVFEEMDLDEILRIKPSLVLVDELAHSNVPGSRHPKRWQDVLEILDAGINVYTTLNVQHIESRKDVVESITGIHIRETVPDLILERAAEIELIDLAPSELLKRLKEGKVYLGIQSELAAQNFFREDNLTALREIALRFTAEKVDHDLHELTIAGKPLKKWTTNEKLMVAVSAHPNSHYLIRHTRRRAFRMDCPWLAVYVDNGTSLTEEENDMLSKNLALARNLGAEVVTISDPDISGALGRIAKYKQATQIIVGRSPTPTLVERFFGGTLIDKLTRRMTDIDIHIVHQPYEIRRKSKKISFIVTSHLSDYLKIGFLIGILTLLNSYVMYGLGFKTIGFTYLLFILIISLFYSYGPILFAAILSSVISNVLFVLNSPIPIFYDWNEIVYVLLYFTTALVTGMLTARIKKRELLLQQREEKNQTIYEIVRAIASSRSNEQAFKAVKERLGRLFKGECHIIIKDQNNRLNFAANESLQNNEKEHAVAIWCFENGKEAGWGTDTLPSVSYLCVPLRGYSEIVGVLSFKPNNFQKKLTLEEMNIIHTVAQQLGYYLERYFSEERARQRDYKLKIDKLHQTLFNSISVEFKNPLNSIKNAVKYLKEDDSLMQIQKTSVNQIENSSENLSRFVENILLMAQFGTGFFSIDSKPNSISELIETCMQTLKKSLKNHKLIISIQENLPLITFDFSLLEILLCNVLLNASSYSPEGSTIEIEAKIEGDNLRLSVKDYGEGIPPSLVENIFQKFYKVPGTSSEGMGLGLPIAKAIAELHHGQLEAQNRIEGGTEFYLLLPLKYGTIEKQRKLRKI